jgi:hypothetical protein
MPPSNREAQMADRISVDFVSLNNNELWMCASAVAKALDGSIKYPNPKFKNSAANPQNPNSAR